MGNLGLDRLLGDLGLGGLVGDFALINLLRYLVVILPLGLLELRLNEILLIMSWPGELK
jgi:hypothetical protein